MTNEGEIIFSDESDSLLSRFYHERILSCLVYIERECLKTGVKSCGSGTVIGFVGKKNDVWLPLIATAGHVVRSQIGEQFRFNLTRFSWNDPFNPISRNATFMTGGKDARSPRAVYYSGPHNNYIDIGFIMGPSHCEDGMPFFAVDEQQFPVATETVPFENEGFWTVEGTRLAWCGYPAIASDVAQRPQPCYFEGCVSALILRNEFPLYLIDGHNTFGVSGGPIWTIGGRSTKPRVIGVISSYGWNKTNLNMPGFVYGAPVQPLADFLRKNWGAKFDLNN
ncbi:MAG: hypothetical protein WEB58_03765 [Planctomycetaceae bacterium]